MRWCYYHYLTFLEGHVWLSHQRIKLVIFYIHVIVDELYYKAQNNNSTSTSKYICLQQPDYMLFHLKGKNLFVRVKINHSMVFEQPVTQ